MGDAGKLRAADGLPRFWWSQLSAVPSAQRGLEYERLKRVWFDQTGARSWFRNPKCEAHLVATLFENMVLFDPCLWVPELLSAAAVQQVPQNVISCRWNYEFEDDENIKNNKPSIADLVLCARDASGEFVLVIEAKRGKGALKAGDHDPEYYLGSPKLKTYSRRYMLYLIDESDRATTRPPIAHDQGHRGLITWQQFAGLQISLVDQLDLPDVIKRFIAGAIQYQFCQHDIRPTVLSSRYFEREPAYETMPTGQHQPGAQQTPERRLPIWKCDWED